MSSYLEGMSLGDRIVGEAFDEYNQQKAYQDRLTERADEKQRQGNAAATANYYKSQDLDLAKKKLGLDQTNSNAEADLRKSQKDFYDAEAASVRAGKGRYGAGGAGKTPVDLLQANKNLENARKAISAYATGGQKPPDELQDAYHAALADVDKLSQGLGLNPAAPKPAVTNNAPVDSGLHPIDSTMAWFKKIAGSSAPSASDIQTRTLKDGTQVQVRKMPDGTYEQVQ